MRRVTCRRVVLALGTLAVAACGFDGIVTGGTGSTNPAESDAASTDGNSSGADSASRDAAPSGDGDISLGDGSIADAPADTTPPVVHAGKALRFGAGSYVDIGALAVPTDFTFEAWVRPAAAGGAATETYIVAKDRSGQGQGQCRFGLDPTRHLFFMLTDSAANDHGLYDGDYVLIAPAPLALDTWAHVAVTKSGAAFALLVDGAKVSALTATAAFAHGGPAVSFRVGGRVATDGTSVADGFTGVIDEVRIWNVARTPAQIAASMRTPITPPVPALVGSWRFEEGAGSTTADGAGTHPGTLVASPMWIASTAY